jgi:hypothetical protein
VAGVGLEPVATAALWFYAYPPWEYSKVHRSRCWEIDRSIKALERARSVACERLVAGDSRANVFFGRFLKKYVALTQIEMPFADDGSTFGYWLLPRMARRNVIRDLTELRKTFVSLGGRGPILDPKRWLVDLRVYAANAGVHLGSKRLAALANASDPGQRLDERTMARYIRYFSPSWYAKTAHDIEHVPPPPMYPTQI